MTGNKFGIAKSLTNGILAEKIAPELIEFPAAKADVRNCSCRFLKRFGFPQVIGCMDCIQISIKQPLKNYQDYFSGKMRYSINCQAVCDVHGKFIDVEIKSPGSVHDASVCINCAVQKSYSAGKFKLSGLLDGREFLPQLLLADPIYPFVPYVMKEYDHCNSNDQVVYNAILCSARNQIEYAFGCLKTTWRVLNRAIDVHIKHVPNVIFAYFVLHDNFEKQTISVDLVVVENIIIEERRNGNKVDKINSYTAATGGKVRETLIDYYKEFMQK